MLEEGAGSLLSSCCGVREFIVPLCSSCHICLVESFTTAGCGGLLLPRLPAPGLTVACA